MHIFLDQESRFLGLDYLLAAPEQASVVIVPVPFEKTSSCGTGSKKGAEAILSASHEVELFDADLGYEPCKTAGGIATLAPLRVDEGDDGKAICDRVARVVSHWLSQGKRVVTLAGEHTGVVGAIRAHIKSGTSVTVLQLDAHSDLRDSYLDDPWNHACTMARVLDVHQDLAQVGIRSEAAEERAKAERMNLSVFRAADIKRDDRLGRDWVGPIIDKCSENVYVTMDCDVLDPSIMPATGTPEPGGLTWEQLNHLLVRICRERNVVGFDMSEVSPMPSLHYPEYTAAKLLYRFIGCLFYKQRSTAT